MLLVEQFCVFLTFTTVVFLRCSSCLASNGLYRFCSFSSWGRALGAAVIGFLCIVLILLRSCVVQLDKVSMRILLSG